MKRILPLFLTLSVSPFVYAAPQTAAPEALAGVVTAPDPAPVVDPLAGALLAKSASAYSALTGLSMHFDSTRVIAGKTISSSGEVSLSRPGKAKVVATSGDVTTVTVADGEKLWQRLPTKPASYSADDLKAPASMGAALRRVDAVSGLPISALLEGKSFLDMGFRLGTVSMAPDNSVKLTMLPGKTPASPVISFVLKFDPTDNLLRSTEVSFIYPDRSSNTQISFSDVKVNPVFTPATFTYTPAPDEKLYVEPPAYDPRLVVGAAPFPLQTKDLAGNDHSWADFKGKVVLLDFWATWCGPCVAELPNVVKTYDAYHSKGFEVVGISLDSDQKALTDFIKARDLKYLNLYDQKNGQANPDAQSYGVRFIPFTLLIGKDGKIAAVNPRGEKLEPALIEALAKPAPVAETTTTETKDAETAAVAPPANPAIDAAAKALLDQTARAYAALNGLSMRFRTYNLNEGVTSNINGDIAFAQKDKVKVSATLGKVNFLRLSDGKKIYMQTDPKTYNVDTSPPGTHLQNVLGSIPSLFGVPLSMLATGKNPLDTPIKWNSASLLPDNGVSLTLRAGQNGPLYKFNLYVDPTDSLLRRVEVTVTNKGKSNLSLTTFNNVTENPDFTPDTFAYKIPKGAKLYVQPPMYDPKLVVGKAPYALKGKDLQGKTPIWSQYKGKVVLLDFWATWCGPCVGELPNVLANYKKYHPKGMEIVGVSLDQDKKALTDFIKARGLKYPNVFDGKGWGAVDGKTYGVQAIPFSLLIGKDGKIAAVNPRGELLEPALIKALAK